MNMLPVRWLACRDSWTAAFSGWRFIISLIVGNRDLGSVDGMFRGCGADLERRK